MTTMTCSRISTMPFAAHNRPARLCRLALCLFFTLAISGSLGRAAELHVVWKDDLGLYSNQRLRRTLERGEIVPAGRHPDARDWYVIRYDDKLYSTRKAGLKSEREVKFYYEGRIRKFEDRLDRLNDDLNALGETRIEIIRALYLVERDTALYYRLAVQKIELQPDATDTPGKHTAVVTTAYRYEPVIRRAIASQFEHDWLERLEETEETIAARREERREVLGDIAAEQEAYDRFIRRFERYRQNAETYRMREYLCVKKDAPLYKNRRAVDYVREDTIVEGAPSRKFEDWLVIIRGDRQLYGRESHFRTRQSFLKEYRPTVIELEHDLAVTESELEFLRLRERLLRRLILALEAREGTGGEYSVIGVEWFKDWRNPYYELTVGDEGTLVVRRAVARIAIRDWEDILEDVRKTLARLTDRRSELRRDLLQRKQRLEDILALFAEGPPEPPAKAESPPPTPDELPEYP